MTNVDSASVAINDIKTDGNISNLNKKLLKQIKVFDTVSDENETNLDILEKYGY